MPTITLNTIFNFTKKRCFSISTHFFVSINYIVQDIKKLFSHNKQGKWHFSNSVKFVMI